MQNNMLYIVAVPDEAAAAFIGQLRAWLTSQGIPMDQPALPPHLLLCGYPAASGADVLRLAADVAAKTRSFAFSYSHVGIAPEVSAQGAAILLAPEVNRPLLTLRERFVHSQGWLLHTPLLSVPPQLLPQVLPWVLPNVKPFDARVIALAVYRQDGTQLGLFPL